MRSRPNVKEENGKREWRGRKVDLKGDGEGRRKKRRGKRRNTSMERTGK